MTKPYGCCVRRCYGATLLLIVVFTIVVSRLRLQPKYSSFRPNPSTYAPFIGSATIEIPHVAECSDFYGYSGSTELKQYSEFIRRHPKFVLKLTEKPYLVKPPVDYRVTVSVICGTKQPIKCDDTKISGKSNFTGERRHANVYENEGVFMSINERHNGNQKPSGGSSFRITSTTSVTRQMCSYVDKFDGTYVVWCPLSRESECSNLSVSLDFFNFTAYTGPHYPLRDVKWHQAVCRQQQLQCSDKGRVEETGKTLLRHTDLDDLQCETVRRNAVTWQRQKDRWRARLSWERNSVFEMNQAALCERLKQFGRVIFVGASHMRYKSDHLVIQCFDMPRDVGRKHDSMAVGNVEYIRVSYAKQFTSIAHEILKRNLTKRDLVLVQTGAYDMFKYGLQKTMTLAVPVFSRALREIRDLSRKRGFRVVFVTSPSYPRNDSRKARGSRNNFALAAFNGSVKKEMVDIGLEIFDEFSAFLTHEEESICGSHYLCRTIGDLKYVSGELGKTAAELLVRHAPS